MPRARKDPNAPIVKRAPKPRLEELASVKRYVAADVPIDGDDVDMNVELGYLRMLVNSLPASKYGDKSIVILGGDFTEVRPSTVEKTIANATA